MLVDYSFILSNGPFQMDAYGRKWETCPTTSSNTATDRKGLDVRSDPEAQDPASLAPLRKRMLLRAKRAGVLRCFS
jgi:hypothetical protein